MPNVVWRIAIAQMRFHVGVGVKGVQVSQPIESHSLGNEVF